MTSPHDHVTIAAPEIASREHRGISRPSFRVREEWLLEIAETALPGVFRIVPPRFGDARGFFSETWNRRRMQEAGLDFEFVQDNHSYSAEPATVRGLHYQSPPMAQTKLISVIEGAVRDVVVDARRGSPTYGRWIAEELSAEKGVQILVPRGFLHGFVTLSPRTHVLYKVDAFYAPECDGAVRFDDPDLGIEWGINPRSAVLSDKDARAPSFRDFVSPFKVTGG